MAKKKKQDDTAAEVARALRVHDGFALTDLDPASTPGLDGKRKDAEKIMAASVDELDELQERLYAGGRDGDGPAVLLVVQGMDTSGKGGVMRHVIGAVDPQGVHLHAFKAPTQQEKQHPFLWRIKRELPEPGMIGVFDRSHYEDVLVVRVHDLVPEEVWSHRYGEIKTFEQGLVDRGIHLVKVMLHISYEEQGERLRRRLDRPDKWWKFNPGDIDERARWADYRQAYQAVLDKTDTDAAPWYVVPADHKWYARFAVQQILLHTLREIDPQWPAATFDVEEQKRRLAQT